MAVRSTVGKETKPRTLIEGTTPVPALDLGFYSQSLRALLRKTQYQIGRGTDLAVHTRSLLRRAQYVCL